MVPNGQTEPHPELFRWFPQYPKPREPDKSLFIWAALLFLIAAWQAYEHSYWIFMAVFLCAGVVALDGERTADKEYKIAKLQFDLGMAQVLLHTCEEKEKKEAASWDVRYQIDLQRRIVAYGEEIRELHSKIDAINRPTKQTKWHYLGAFLGSCCAVVVLFSIVWMIDVWLWEESRLKSWFHGVIDSAIKDLIPWAVIVGLGIVASYALFEIFYETKELVKQRAWRKLIDKTGGLYVFVVVYSLFWWVWGDVSWFGVPSPVVGGAGAAALFLWIQILIYEKVPNQRTAIERIGYVFECGFYTFTLCILIFLLGRALRYILAG